jgi:ADP-ribose pyrophosphatase YjhB (NUDIX family)
MENGPAAAATKTAANTRSVALSLSDAALPGLLLVVRRPANDAHLPGIWGLPAASLRHGESWTAAAHRAAQDKLGVDIALGREIARGRAVRDDGILEMRLYAARITSGRPRVPQDAPGVTQYVALRWALPDVLEAGAARGSLCCRLQLGRAAQSDVIPS